MNEFYHVTITAKGVYEGFTGIAERVPERDFYYVKFDNRPDNCIQGDIFYAINSPLTM